MTGRLLFLSMGFKPGSPVGWARRAHAFLIYHSARGHTVPTLGMIACAARAGRCSMPFEIHQREQLQA